MSRLSDLKQKIEKIPQQNAAVERAEMLIRQSKHIEKIRNDFESAVLHIGTLGEYKELDLGREKQKITQFLNSVKTIKVQFDDIKNFSRVIYRNWLEKNKDVPIQVTSSVNMKWTSHVQTQLSKYKSIMDLANNAKLPGAKKMSQELSDIAITFENIPSEPSQIESFEKRIAEFPTYISSLGLNPKIENFLKKASGAGADPNLLFDDEIKEFLQTNSGLLAQMKLKITV
jgi:hypothetical protein